LETAEKLYGIFHGSNRAHGSFTVGIASTGQKTQGTAKTIKTVGANLKHWQKHLEGQEGLGIIPIDEENCVKWGAIDIDLYSLNLEALVKKIEEFKLPLVVCRSKSGGAHVYCFLKEKAPAGDMQDKLREIAAGLGYGGVEIFPKQREVLVDRGDIGSWLNMPYFEGDTSLRYAFDKKGKALTVEGFIKFVEKRSITHEELLNLDIPTLDDIKDGPPCLQVLLKQGFPQGTRNNGLFNVGVYLKKANPEKWETEIEDYNRKYVSPPLPAQEVLTLISTLRKKEYNYKCSDEPIKSYCNVAKCRTCKFGVGGGGAAPTFSSLAKLDSKPPLWFLSIDDKRLELSTEQLQNQIKFQRVCMETLNIMPPRMNDRGWQALIQNLMDNGMEIIEVSNDISVDGQFNELLESFCTDMAQANSKEEILLGKPFTEEGRTFFRIKDLKEYLVKHRFTELETNRIASKLRDMKAEHKFVNMKGRGVNLWSIPEFDYGEEVALPTQIFDEGGI
jgi:hypothetical protein|tara:strand:+ start:1084 stop:2592 length:1509 start_codon:yes stop_codon:yes gene_type:complete